MHNRDQLDTFWPMNFTAKDNAERPAEGLYRATQGSDFGWPYCFYDYTTKMLVLNPEYGGDGKAGRPLLEVHVTGRGVSRALGAGGHQVLHGLAVPGEVSQRRVHRLPRIVEPLAAAAGRLQRDVPAVLQRQAVGRSSKCSPTDSPARRRSRILATRSRVLMALRRRPMARCISARARRARSGG